MSRFGVQPAAEKLYEQGITYRHAAAELGITANHLSCAVRGIVRPKPEVRKGLPKLLGIPLSKLFTPEAIAKPYIAGRGKHVGAPSGR